MNRNMDPPAGPAVKTAPPAEQYELPEPPVPFCSPEEYDAWFRARVQEALDDPRPELPFDEAMVKLDALLDNKRRAPRAKAVL